jgi:hypothetical protein
MMASNMRKVLFAILALCCIAQAQIPYPFLTPPRFQAIDANGAPLAGGFLYTYAAGGSVPLATYHLDTLGNITPNTNPIILDSTGSAEIRLLPQSYKMTLQDMNHVQIWSIDQIVDVGDVLLTQAVLLNPVGGALQTIAGPLAVTNISAGGAEALGSTAQSGTGFLCLTNGCALGSPTINSVQEVGGVQTGYVLQNNSSPGTTQNTLTKIVNTGGVSALTQLLCTDTGGAEGIVSAGAGIVGSATLITGGNVGLLFDGPTTGGDYVQISSTSCGYGHDAGTSYPAGGQVIGKLLDTVASPGTSPVLIDKFSSEIQAGSGATLTTCSNGTFVSLNANTTNNQIFNTCLIPGGTLNKMGATFRLTGNFILSPGSSITSYFAIGWGSSTALGSSTNILQQTANPSQVEGITTVTCVVSTPGSAAVIACAPMVTWDGALGGSPAPFVTQTPFQFGYDLTTPLYVGTACSFGTGSASNACSERVFTVSVN